MQLVKKTLKLYSPRAVRSLLDITLVLLCWIGSFQWFLLIFKHPNGLQLLWSNLRFQSFFTPHKWWTDTSFPHLHMPRTYEATWCDVCVVLIQRCKVKCAVGVQEDGKRNVNQFILSRAMSGSHHIQEQRWTLTCFLSSLSQSIDEKPESGDKFHDLYNLIWTPSWVNIQIVCWVLNGLKCCAVSIVFVIIEGYQIVEEAVFVIKWFSGPSAGQCAKL